MRFTSKWYTGVLVLGMVVLSSTLVGCNLGEYIFSFSDDGISGNDALLEDVYEGGELLKQDAKSGQAELPVDESAAGDVPDDTQQGLPSGDTSEAQGGAGDAASAAPTLLKVEGFIVGAEQGIGEDYVLVDNSVILEFPSDGGEVRGEFAIILQYVLDDECNGAILTFGGMLQGSYDVNSPDDSSSNMGGSGEALDSVVGCPGTGSFSSSFEWEAKFVPSTNSVTGTITFTEGDARGELTFEGEVVSQEPI